MKQNKNQAEIKEASNKEKKHNFNLLNKIHSQKLLECPRSFIILIFILYFLNAKAAPLHMSNSNRLDHLKIKNKL